MTPADAARGLQKPAVMRHVFFALFDDKNRAIAALRDMRLIHEQFPRTPFKVRLHGDSINNEKLPVAQTNSRRRMLQGVVQGIFFGALIGVLFMVLGIADVRPPVILGFTALAGAAVGALGGALAGAGAPDSALDDLAREAQTGNVVMSVETSDGDAMNRAEAICAEHGARVEQRIPA